MYYQNYEDYMRNILGYSTNNNHNMVNNYTNTMYDDYLYNMPRYSSEILDLYPEIYKIINPMVCKICDSNTKPITKELIDKMTEEIYLNIESDPYIIENDTVNVRVNLPKESEKNDINKYNLSMSNTNYQKENRKERINIPNRDNRTDSNTITGTSNHKDSTQERRIVSNNLKDNKEGNNLSIVKESVGEKRVDIYNQDNREYRQRRQNNHLRDLIRILILNRLLGGNFRPHRPNPPRPPYPVGPRPNPPRPNPMQTIEPRYLYKNF